MSSYRDLDVEAHDALEAARSLPHGAERSEAMKKAGKLRVLAEASRGAEVIKAGRSAK